jgi:catechol 2,3-dioxygenase-like lactoylglutathione lyase family enzyme
VSTQVHHFATTVSDIDRSVDFYTGYFSLREILRTELTGEGISSAMELPGAKLTASLLAGENAIIELICFKEPTAVGYGGSHAGVGVAHPAFVVEDLDALYERMSADGVHFNAPPQELGWDTKMAYCRDPDGLFVELIEPGEPLQLERLLASEAREEAR